MSWEGDGPRPEACGWRPYDAGELVCVAVPEPAKAALTARGLPDNAYGHFVRVPERELEVAQLPECGRAAFLAHVEDGYNNTYWLSLTDGSVWMRYGSCWLIRQAASESPSRVR
jgi:hypothetical protein